MSIYRDRCEDLEIEVAQLKKMIEAYKQQISQKLEFRYDNVEQRQFEGTLVITDPCYFVKDEDWKKSIYGASLIDFGINTYITADTGFGDWQNSIIDNKHHFLGHFCADSGQVTIALLEEIKKYNPNFKEILKEQPNIATIIPNFKGNVSVDTSNKNWTIIKGSGNINFHSDCEDDFYDEPEED